jgi:hypothetical protein
MIKRRIVLYMVQTFLFLVLSGCWVNEYNSYDVPIEGYRPVYGTTQSQEITLTGARSVNNPGKIYVYGRFLLVNEMNKGIHVFDNTTPENPKAVGFVQLLGNTDMAIRNDILYADHMGNLVALQVHDFEKLTSIGTLPLQDWNLGIPPPGGFYFECVDPEKGIVTGWKRATLKKRECYASY